MERTLDPDRLRELIGSGGNGLLPTPERLIEVMVYGEIGLITRERREEDLELLELVGWFLFGAAASKLALEYYSVPLRRQAFQVAGHLFDLALRTKPVLDELHRARLCFASQISYLRGDLHPNALAILRKTYPSGIEWQMVLDAPPVAALQGAILLLGGQVRSLKARLLLIGSEAAALRERWRVETLSNTLLGAAFDVCSGLAALLRFQERGDRASLEQARNAFRSAAEIAFGDPVSKWVGSHLLDLSGDLEGASVWTVLPPDVPEAVKLAFTQQEPAVLTLWPPQVEFLGGQERRLFAPGTRRVFLASPTSAGKTLLAQVIVAAHLGSGGRGACFVVPTRSLSTEVSRSLRRRLRRLGVTVTQSELLANDEPLTDLPQGRVIVMTPEKLSFLLHADPEKVLAAFDLFVFDEVHNIGNARRGWLLESLITYLHTVTQEADHRLVLMSAAIGNKNHFIEWLTIGEAPYSNVDSVHEEWRGPRRITAVYRTSRGSSRITRPVKGKTSVRVVYPLEGRLSSPMFGRVNRDLVITEPVGELVHRYPDASLTGRWTRDEQTTPQYRTVVPLVKELTEAGMVLAVLQNKKLVETFALALANRLPVPSETPQLEALLEEVTRALGQDHPLARTLPRGVAFHHADVPFDLRARVEQAAEQGVLRCIVCTSSLTEGVNLPVHSVVIVQRRDHEGIPLLTPSQLLNALGRAGRAAIETEGVLILAAQGGETDDQVLREARPPAHELQTRSTLTDAAVIGALMKLEEAIRGNHDALFESKLAHAEGFVQFVWFLAAQRGGQPSEVIATLRQSLAGQQLENWSAVEQAVSAILQVFEATAPADRQRWARASTSLSTSYRLDRIAALVEADEEIAGLMGVDLLSRLFALTLPELLELSEVQASLGPSRLDWPHQRFLDAWLTGGGYQDLITALPELRLSVGMAQKYAYDFLEFTLPWLISCLLDRVQARANVGWIMWHDLPTLAALVRYGVPSLSMIPAVREGRLTRALAVRIWPRVGLESPEEDIKAWLRAQSVPEWRGQLDLSPYDVETLLEYVELPLEPIVVENMLQAQLTVENLPQTCTRVECVVQTFKGIRWLSLKCSDDQQIVVDFPVAFMHRALELLDEGYNLTVHTSKPQTLVFSLPFIQ
ncbi:hypothetical protein DVJ83_17525 (plasmid) [Deinococcus wulumuqiensis]|uniref:DEAD/DEAH box helicase n=1 Tax=Deinococcus wulumuqiensis TaxID=980427 RepID=A0A345IMI7_9DEIO|nr:DEAD/DEAH box helicase [Deinococcus wulumuqiensis]AXH00910.1 hypothetical protein DVJ83_17525 [Deinococcus wulumuqiensis]